MDFATYQHQGVTLKKADQQEFEEYKDQRIRYFCEYPQRDYFQVFQESGRYYLAAIDDNGRQIALIRVVDIGDTFTAADVTVAIFNQKWKKEYCAKVIDAIITCFKKRGKYKMVYLNCNSSATEFYRRQKPQVFNGYNQIMLKKGGTAVA